MKSLRAKLLVLLTAAVLTAALVQSVAVFRNAMREADAVFDYHLQQIALSLATGELGLPGFGPRGHARDDLDYVFQVWAPDGQRIYVSRPRVELPDQAVLGYANVAVNGQNWRVFSMQAGGRTIQVAQPLLSRRALALTFALNSVWPMLLIVPLLLLVVAWVVRRSLAPLRALSTELENRAATSFDPLDPGAAMLEMRPVVRAMNGLFARTRQAFDAQQMFVADAAHELRSPLAALKLQLQMLERASDDPARRVAAQRLDSGIDRATHLVEQLLALARADSGGRETPASSSLTDAARQALADTLDLAQARGIDAGLEQAEELTVLAPPQGLRMLARNLVDNAVRYSPRGARVDVRVREQDGKVLLEVDDSGPGIPEADRPRVFDRFYRRADAPPGGSGLGLAIVRSVAERSHASVELLDSPLGGLRVRVSFPRPS
ncbi:MAG: two-component sensor histidine kinase [Betaproteobacteria bacterium]|nr:two-component sensor histidine kinase [Betaproteobacteria bacterium]MBU6511234.1 two-component sensor histidine kinase [Betaproteobacteria bacterium]MDE1955927.1 two-component sensor histidine kinase [Betaproteobacteria bacterium]MDE2151564.1 two-component sensor histidine kinase [Betaproteobacteria bacterium]